MSWEKCNSCLLRYHCGEQTEWICTHNNFCEYISDSEEVIENTVAKERDAEPVRHGAWEYDHWCRFKCSECGCFSLHQEKYCPNCGTKMDIG